MNIFSPMQSCRIPLLLATVLTLGGCSLAPDYEQPSMPLPEQWPTSSQGVSSDSGSAVVPDWEDFVTDETLRKLIEVALASNLDLRQAVLNVEAVRAQYRIQRSEQLPSVEAQANMQRQRIPANLSSTGNNEIQQTYQVSLGVAAFELDLFGRIRSLSEAALQEYLASEQAAQSVRISLVSEVIQAYLIRNSAQQRYLLSAQTLESREASLVLVEKRRIAGTASALDYQNALGLTQQARVELERANREFLQAGNALGLLIGDPVAIAEYLPENPSSDLLIVQNIGAGAPSDLLERRPDIQLAEYQLRARNADIGAARAAFFPRITLTGMFGTTSVDLSSLFDPVQHTWSFMPQITLPIFEGGRNMAALDLAKVRKDIAVAAYERSIQVAFREVADALAATETLQREEMHQQELAASSSRALHLAKARYNSGLDDYLWYLDTQRSDFINQTALIEISTQRQLAQATLFRTLGGGWHVGVPEDESQPASN